MTRQAMIKFIKAVRKDDPNIDSVLWNMSTEAVKATYLIELDRVDQSAIDQMAEMGI